jgi:hypothetical protein
MLRYLTLLVAFLGPLAAAPLCQPGTLASYIENGPCALRGVKVGDDFTANVDVQILEFSSTAFPVGNSRMSVVPEAFGTQLRIAPIDPSEWLVSGLQSYTFRYLFYTAAKPDYDPFLFRGYSSGTFSSSVEGLVGTMHSSTEVLLQGQTLFFDEQTAQVPPGSDPQTIGLGYTFSYILREPSTAYEVVLTQEFDSSGGPPAYINNFSLNQARPDFDYQTTIPEPGTIGLLGFSLAAFAAVRKSRNPNWRA